MPGPAAASLRRITDGRLPYGAVEIDGVPVHERTLFTLQWLSDPDLRQRSHAGLNKGEASNSLRRAVFFHRQGEIRDRTF